MDASVGFLLENLKELVQYQADLIKGAEDEFKALNDDLAKFRAILDEASRKSRKDEIFQQWERRIREAVYDIEDVIDTCVTEAKAGKAGKRNRFKKTFSTSKGTLVLAQEVRTIRQKTVTPLMKEFEAAKFNIADETDTTVADARKTRQQKSPHIVGFEKEAAEFVERLTQDSTQSEVLSVFGMAGLGKTTFAWKVYDSDTIKFEFPVRIWVNVSEKPNMRKVYLDILSKLTSTKPDESVTDEELVMMIKGHLEDGKYLIVMDDIWTIDAWKILKKLLPETNKWVRVLITTRNTDVGFAASPHEAHKLRFLTDDESWELLQYQVFNKVDGVPHELSEVGQSIAIDCKGLPLSIVVIGGILLEKISRSGDNNVAIKKEWVELSTSVKSYLAKDKNKVLGSIISLSYDKLPYKLRHCFLYFGIFPEDADIPVKKLIQLWIAEELVQDTEGRRLEEVALDNLKELINRNLVMVRKAKLDGEPKICQIHDSIREICKTEGKKLNLFTEVSKPGPHPETLKIRRLCIHSHALNFFSTKPKLSKARSFLCFNESPMTLEGRDTTAITDAFGLLRVYDAKDMKFKIFPAKLVQQLHHLRYLTLAVTSDFNVLPESITNLWNLQTLIVDTPSSTLEFKGDVWKMRHLRHVKTKASISLMSKKGEDDNGANELQSLTRLSPGSCTMDVCKKATSLLTLGIQGDLRDLGDSKCFAELDSLKKLKLVHEVSRGGAADNPLRHLPDAHSFPPTLKTLVLSGTRLDWAKMSILSAISTLEELKLKEHAFHGITWEAVGTGFNHLICLDIGRAGLKHWKVSNEHFPELKFLYINNCENLLVIPTTLGKKLEVLSLEHVSEGAIRSAKKIVDEELKDNKRVIRLNIAVGDKR